MPTTDQIKGEVARRDDAGNGQVARTNGQPTVHTLLERMKPEIGRALPKHMDPDRLARIALTVFRQTPALARCTPESFLGALMTSAQLGLEPGPTGEAYLVPYGNNVTFIPGYRGLIKLAWQSGQLSSISAETVHEHDHFVCEYGTEARLEHRRPPLGQPRGRAIGYYAVAKMKTGGVAFVVMDRDEVEVIRKRSRAKDSGPWQTDYDAMAKKTCIRQLSKYLPLSPEVYQALAQEGNVRTDLSPDVLDETPPFIEGEVVGVEDEVAADTQTGEIVEPAVEDPPAEPDWPETAQPGSGGRRGRG